MYEQKISRETDKTDCFFRYYLNNKIINFIRKYLQTKLNFLPYKYIQILKSFIYILLWFLQYIHIILYCLTI